MKITMDINEKNVEIFLFSLFLGRVIRDVSIDMYIDEELLPEARKESESLEQLCQQVFEQLASSEHKDYFTTYPEIEGVHLTENWEFDFWDRLVDKLAEREYEKRYKNKLADLPDDEKSAHWIEKGSEIKEAFNKEFELRGINRLKIVK